MSTETRNIRRAMAFDSSLRTFAMSAIALYALGCTLVTVVHIAHL
jgi:hypothetical protein